MTTIKTTVSIDGDLFCQAKELAYELQVSWSGLVSLALKAFIERHETRKIMNKLNEVYADGITEEEQFTLDQMARLYAETQEPEEW